VPQKPRPFDWDITYRCVGVAFGKGSLKNGGMSWCVVIMVDGLALVQGGAAVAREECGMGSAWAAVACDKAPSSEKRGYCRGLGLKSSDCCTARQAVRFEAGVKMSGVVKVVDLASLPHDIGSSTW
jgi:hypothetical protein